MDQERLLREAGAVPQGKIARLTRQLAVDVPACEHAVVAGASGYHHLLGLWGHALMAAEWKVGDTIVVTEREGLQPHTGVVTAVDDSEPGVVVYTVQPADEAGFSAMAYQYVDTD